MSYRIAVADDERDTREFFQEMLVLMGHQVVASCADGDMLLEACLATSPELVITDIKMPKLSGVDAASEIYRQLRIPVILVSAYHDAELIRQVSNLQVSAYLVKPIRRAELETAIPIAVRRFEQYQALKSLVHGVLDSRRAAKV